MQPNLVQFNGWEVLYLDHITYEPGSAELKAFFSQCKDGKIRAFKVAIKDEELVLEKSCESIGTWEQDILLF
ncbi:UNVERIFIED_CONTAM: Twf2 [Trichonephila clavipes]